LKGGYIPSWQASFGATYAASSRLNFSFRGGHTYHNAKFGSYDVPVNTPLVLIYAPCPVGKFPDCAPGTTTSGFPTIQTNYLTQFDILRRTNLSFDAGYFSNFHGQHNLKGGYQTNLINNKLLSGDSGGVFHFYFDQSFLGQRGI